MALFLFQTLPLTSYYPHVTDHESKVDLSVVARDGSLDPPGNCSSYTGYFYCSKSLLAKVQSSFLKFYQPEHQMN